MTHLLVWHASTLLLWALLSIFVGRHLFYSHSAVQWRRFFGLMNGVWGVIDLLVAVFLVSHAGRYLFDPAAIVSKLPHAVRMQQLNLWLDSIYLLAWVCLS
jgi:thiol:disulfide interchange protein